MTSIPKIDPYRKVSEMTIAEYAIIKFTTALIPNNEIKDAVADAIEVTKQIFITLNKEQEDADQLERDSLDKDKSS